MLIITTPSIDGEKIVKYLGLVSGDAVIGVDLDYEALQVGQGGGMLMVSANSTAVITRDA